MRAAIRLVLALTLLGWGQFVIASTITWWTVGQSGTKYASWQAAVSAEAPSLISPVVYKISGTRPALETYQIYANPDQNGVRHPSGFAYFGTTECPFGNTGLQCNASCDAPKVMQNGHCVLKDCSSHNGKFIVAAVDGRLSGKLFIKDDVVSIDGAEYITAPDGRGSCKANFDGSGTGICTGRYAGTGNCMPSGHSPDDDLAEGTYVDVTDSSADSKCLTFDGKELCLSPDNAGCDIYNGNPWCYQEGDTCGEIGGAFVCLPDKSRQCTYVAGKMECIETGNPQGSSPPNYIPDTSSDHPYNGGNADGNDKNDPKAPGTAGGSGGGGGGSQGSDSAATNESVDALGDKIDESNSLLDDIRDLLTGDGDTSGSSEGSAADAEAQGEGVGDAVGESITAQMEALDEERNEEIQDALDQLPNQVGEWFSADGSSVGLDFMDNILPSPIGCSDYVVPFSLGNYTANIRLPVCALIPYKPILEWVIWCLTAIGAWRIGYSALRQQDAQAAKGGY